MWDDCWNWDWFAGGMDALMKMVAYDTETTGLYPFHGDSMFCYSTCDEQGNVGFQRVDGPRLRQLVGTRKLREFWSDTSTAKVMHNAKFDLHMTEKHLGRKLDEHTIHCTHKMSHVLQNDHHGHRLKDLAWELAEFPTDDEKAVKHHAKGMEKGYALVPEWDLEQYAGNDAERTILLAMFMLPKIQANPEFLECYQTEIDLIVPTMRMEQRGVMVDKKRCTKLILALEDKVEQGREDLFAVVGRRFNTNSDTEIRRILYTDLGYPVIKRTDKAKLPSVDKHVLGEFRETRPHPVLELILRLRSETKGVTTLSSYLELADHDGVIRPDIHTCQAVTTREAIRHPNLQNVQKAEALLNPFPIPAREAFRPKPGYINLHIDYSGIEMRLLIHYSQDPTMIRILNEGGDVHDAAAIVFYGNRFAKAIKKARKLLRDAAKNANFAIPYGAALVKMMQVLGLRGSAGRQRYDLYQATFPGLCSLNKTIAEEVREFGFVLTAFGRMLRVPRNKAYMGINYKIQGTAAGILKRAQIRVHNYLERETGGEAGLILPIHDEIVMEYPRKLIRDLDYHMTNIRALMVDFPQFSVPMEVEAEVTTWSWVDKRKYPIAA